ncbi:MAG: hypothetical protein H0U59_06240 [Gemmatimonadaceae bacterium]|nr:hypothetical protein [Gemmatimonadaceae bacterium]
MKRVIPALLSVLLVSATIAQDAPSPQRGEGGGGPGDRPERRDGPPGPRGEGGGGGPGGPGGRPFRPPMADRMQHVEMLRGHLELVDRYTRLSSNATSAGVAAVISAAEILKARGNDAAIEYFTKMLPDVKDLTVQRAVRLQLADFYKASNQGDKALEQLRSLMSSDAPATPAAKPAQ